MNIIIVPKEKLYPAFGMADLETKTVYIREDMVDSIAFDFLLCHEKYHITSMIIPRLWAEITANFHAGIRHPIGFFVILWKSIFSLDRWKLYKRLFWDKWFD